MSFPVAFLNNNNNNKKIGSFLLSHVVLKVMDDRWDERVKEYGAINITGFRIIDTERPTVQQFFRTWEALDPAIYPGAGKPFIPVKSNI